MMSPRDKKAVTSFLLAALNMARFSRVKVLTMSKGSQSGARGSGGPVNPWELCADCPYVSTRVVLVCVEVARLMVSCLLSKGSSPLSLAELSLCRSRQPNPDDCPGTGSLGMTTH